MNLLLLVSAAIAGQWIPQVPVGLPATTPVAMEQGSGTQLLLRPDPGDTHLVIWDGGTSIPLQEGPSDTWLLAAPDLTRSLTVESDQDAELHWWAETHQGEAAAWDRYEKDVIQWARTGGPIPPAPAAIDATTTLWEARRRAMEAADQIHVGFLIHSALLDLEEVRYRSSADHGQHPYRQQLLSTGESLQLDTTGPGVLDLDTRILMEDEEFHHYGVAIALDGQPWRQDHLFATEDPASLGWGWARRISVSIPPGEHSVAVEMLVDEAHPDAWGIMRVEPVLDRLRPSLHVLGSAFPHTRILPWSAAELPPIAAMERAFILGEPNANELAEPLLDTVADELARGRLIETVPNPEQALSLFNDAYPSPLLTLALARRWQRLGDVNPARLLQDADLLPMDPALLAALADALPSGFVRPRGDAIRRLAHESVLGLGLTRWTQLIPDDKSAPIRLEGSGGGVSRVRLRRLEHATVALPDSPREERFPVLRLSAEDWVRYRVDGAAREGRGDLHEALSPGLHRVDVEEGELLLLDGMLADGGTPVRDKAAGQLPNQWTLPDPGAPTDLEITVYGPPGDIVVGADDGEVWHIRHQPDMGLQGVWTGGSTAAGGLSQHVITVGPWTRTLRVQGLDDLVVAVAMRRNVGGDDIPLPSPWPDPMATLASASQALVGETDITQRIEARLMRSAALEGIGLVVSSRTESRAVAAHPGATATQRAVGYALYRSTIPPIHTSEFPGPVTVDAALAWARIKMPKVPSGKALAGIAEQLSAPVSWPLHREASAAYLLEGDVVNAWVQAEQAGPLGRLARIQAAGAGDWQRVERVDRNGGTLHIQMPRSPPDESDGLQSMAREVMIGAPWPGEEYAVIRRDKKNEIRFEGEGELRLDLLYRDESFAIVPPPWDVPVTLDDETETHTLLESQPYTLTWDLPAGRHSVRVGPLPEEDRVIAIRATLEHQLLAPHMTVPMHRLGNVGVKATVAGPCLLRIRVHRDGPVYALVDGETREVNDVEIIPVRSTGPVLVTITGLPDATVTLSRLKPCFVPDTPRPPLPSPLDMSIPREAVTRATQRWMNEVSVADPHLVQPLERGGTALGWLAIGNDSTGTRDDSQAYRYGAFGVGWRQRLENTRTWFSAQGQGRASVDGAPGASIEVEIISVPWPGATRGWVNVGSSGPAGHIDANLMHRHRFLLGPWWQVQPYLHGWAGLWSADPLDTVDPLAWNTYSAAHWLGLAGGSYLDWRPLRDARLRFIGQLSSNPNLTFDHADLQLRSDIFAGDNTVLRLGPAMSYRFADGDRSEAYWRYNLTGTLTVAQFHRRNQPR